MKLVHIEKTIFIINGNIIHYVFVIPLGKKIN